MRTISSNFRDALRNVKELIGVVSYKATNGKLLTQASEYLLTQDNDKILLNRKNAIHKVLGTEHDTILETEVGKILGTEKDKYQIDNASIESINISFNAKLLRTVCQSVQIESKEDIDLNSKINIKIGVMVDNEYEYLDMGDFYNIGPSDYQLDTKTYIITGYDAMHKCMKDYDSDPLNVFPITHKNLLEEILNKFGIDFELSSYDNEDIVIDKDLWLGEKLTYRDIVDELVMSGGFGAIIKNNKFINKTYYDTNEEVNAEDLQAENVSIGDLYGPINSLITTDLNGVSYLIGKDTTSIENNGLVEYNWGVNRILASDSSFYTSVFNSIKNLSFYLYNLSSYGLLIFEPLDMFEIRHNGAFKTILLNDNISLTTGLRENLYIEKPEENKEEYITSTPTTSEIKDAIINVDKTNAQIVLKVNSDNRIAEVALNADADSGSAINFKADQIDFEAYDMNLTSENMTITSDNFKVDAEGNMECNNATLRGTLSTNEGSIGGWQITNEGLNNNQVFIGSNGASTIYTVADYFILRAYLNGIAGYDSVANMKNRYDLNKDGVLNAQDLLLLRKMLDIVFDDE